MASFLFVCRSCLGQHRLVGMTAAPPEFDFLCDACRENPPEPVAAAPKAPRKAAAKPAPARTRRRG